ncbi:MULTISPECIES: hypothetical protein [unclassified Pantoea]|uniref:hypothetical protein n=1 Tax=unclassified Pantoea TaxID=2630326 RepID=UPI001EFC5E0B|nr:MULTISPECIES: hypothetical protein [unclassified Pantoea]MDU4125527.1 hypothetical protein [Pantoea sp.]
MMLITKNFRLNALANQYSAAIYNHVRQLNGGDWFPMEISGQRIEVAIVDGSAGIRLLVDSYLLEPMKREYPHWEGMAFNLLSLCLDGNEPSAQGKSIWQSMIDDMSASLSKAEVSFHA